MFETYKLLDYTSMTSESDAEGLIYKRGYEWITNFSSSTEYSQEEKDRVMARLTQGGTSGNDIYSREASKIASDTGISISGQSLRQLIQDDYLKTVKNSQENEGDGIFSSLFGYVSDMAQGIVHDAVHNTTRFGITNALLMYGFGGLVAPAATAMGFLGKSIINKFIGNVAWDTAVMGVDSKISTHYANEQLKKLGLGEIEGGGFSIEGTLLSGLVHSKQLKGYRPSKATIDKFKNADLAATNFFRNLKMDAVSSEFYKKTVGREEVKSAVNKGKKIFDENTKKVMDSDLYDKGKKVASELYDKGKKLASELYDKGKEVASDLYDDVYTSLNSNEKKYTSLKKFSPTYWEEGENLIDNFLSNETQESSKYILDSIENYKLKQPKEYAKSIKKGSEEDLSRDAIRYNLYKDYLEKDGRYYDGQEDMLRAMFVDNSDRKNSFIREQAKFKDKFNEKYFGVIQKERASQVLDNVMKYRKTYTGIGIGSALYLYNRYDQDKEREELPKFLNDYFSGGVNHGRR